MVELKPVIQLRLRPQLIKPLTEKLTAHPLMSQTDAFYAILTDLEQENQKLKNKLLSPTNVCFELREPLKLYCLEVCAKRNFQCPSREKLNQTLG